jgi:hypothetical protein
MNIQKERHDAATIAISDIAESENIIFAGNIAKRNTDIRPICLLYIFVAIKKIHTLAKRNEKILGKIAFRSL